MTTDCLGIINKVYLSHTEIMPVINHSSVVDETCLGFEHKTVFAHY